MEAVINLKNEGHCHSPQIKELRLESETVGVGCYSVFTQWPGHPQLDNYLRIGYEPNTKEISYIDFDGGPWLTYGSIIQNKYVVTGFKHNGEFGDVKILLTECSS